jgi:hypothetical protein
MIKEPQQRPGPEKILAHGYCVEAVEQGLNLVEVRDALFILIPFIKQLFSFSGLKLLRRN